jgi:hypothetical protein
VIKCSFDSGIIQTNTVLSNAKLCAAAFVALDAGAGSVAVESRRAGIDVGSAGFLRTRNFGKNSATACESIRFICKHGQTMASSKSGVTRIDLRRTLHICQSSLIIWEQGNQRSL